MIRLRGEATRYNWLAKIPSARAAGRGNARAVASAIFQSSPRYNAEGCAGRAGWPAGSGDAVEIASDIRIPGFCQTVMPRRQQIKRGQKNADHADGAKNFEARQTRVAREPKRT